MKPKFKYFLFIAVLIFFILRLPQVLRNEFAFVFDMGRDHIWVRNMVELKKPTLIGPWGSLAGVYMGPGWYYFLAIPYIISGGDPRASVITVILANLAALLAGTWFLKKEINTKSAVIFAFLFALSPHNINITTYPFHANLLPITMIAMLISMYYFLQGKTKCIWIAALATSLNFHFEPAAGIFTTLTLLIFLIWQRKKLAIKPFSHLAIYFVAPFIPQLIFELRHNFLQTKAVLSYFQGQNRSLEGILPFPERIFERLRKFSELFSASVFPDATPILAGLTLLCLFILLYKFKKIQNESRLLSLIIWSLIIPLLGFMFLFPPELKGWYLYGFTISYFMLISLFLGKLLDSIRLLLEVSRSNLPKTIGYWLLTIGYLVWLGQFHNRLSSKPISWGPESLKNQISAIETIYTLSDNKPFSLYVYTPPIYDYQYQYLIWWLGKTRGYPQPIEYSYQPGEIAYHPEKDKFISMTGTDPVKIFLLIEPESDLGRLNGWLGHFANHKLISETKLSSGLRLQTRLPSPN